MEVDKNKVFGLVSGKIIVIFVVLYSCINNKFKVKIFCLIDDYVVNGFI